MEPPFARPPVDPGRYDGLAPLIVWSAMDRNWHLEPEPMAEFVAACDVAWSAETWYDRQLPAMLRDDRVRRYLYVMPEYFDPIKNAAQVADRYLSPTEWRRPESAELLPMPVAMDRFEKAYGMRSLDGGPTFLHFQSGSRADRNGTRVAHKAARLNHVKLHVPRGHHDYWEAYEFAGPAVFVFPRRYAGLSMPMLEAAAAGIPWITTDLAPQNEWVPAVWKVDPGHSIPLDLAGGRIPVWQPAASEVAECMRAAAVSIVDRPWASVAAHYWAEDRSWTALAGRWRDTMGV